MSGNYVDKNKPLKISGASICISGSCSYKLSVIVVLNKLEISGIL